MKSRRFEILIVDESPAELSIMSGVKVNHVQPEGCERGRHGYDDSQNLAYMSEVLDRYPNTTVEFGARIDELGRQPRVAMKFFDRYQDRILFGTDFIMDMPGKLEGVDELYEVYYRFLETDDDYFDSYNAP